MSKIRNRELTPHIGAPLGKQERHPISSVIRSDPITFITGFRTAEILICHVNLVLFMRITVLVASKELFL